MFITADLNNNIFLYCNQCWAKNFYSIFSRVEHVKKICKYISQVTFIECKFKKKYYSSFFTSCRNYFFCYSWVIRENKIGMANEIIHINNILRKKSDHDISRNIDMIFSKFYGKVGFFSISFEKITFYTEILTWKVELWIFSHFSLKKKHHKTTFPVKISV